MKKVIFGVLVILIISGSLFVVVNYTNHKTYEGVVSAKMKDQHKKDTYYITIDDKGDERVFKNSMLIFKSRETSGHMQKRFDVGDKVKIQAVGYRIDSINFYPTVYDLKIIERGVGTYEPN